MEKYKITGLHCNDCASNINKNLKSLPGGDGVEINFKEGIISIPEDLDFDRLLRVLEEEKLMIIPIDNTSSDSHDHSHHHDHSVDMSAPGKMLLVFLLNLFFSIAEFIFGKIFNSSAILADAIHDLGDALSIGLAFIFEKVSVKEADYTYTFGYTRFSLLGALITSTVLIAGSIAMIFNGIPLLFNPQIPNHRGMFWMALAAIVMNGLSAIMLRGGDSANQRVLTFHVLEDMLGWIAVLIVSIVLKFKDWYFLDPLLSILIAIFILYNVIPEFLQAVRTFLNSTPNDVPLDTIRKEIESIEMVSALGHLHIWSVDGKNNAFTVSVFADTDDSKEMEKIRRRIKDIIAPYNMAHYTIELIPDIN